MLENEITLDENPETSWYISFWKEKCIGIKLE